VSEFNLKFFKLEQSPHSNLESIVNCSPSFNINHFSSDKDNSVADEAKGSNQSSSKGML